ncbi:MAG: glycosyltransferase family 39 protein [Phycisphaerales bacterium]
MRNQAVVDTKNGADYRAAGTRRYQSWLMVCLVLTSILPMWFSLGDHPFFGRSDGRYAAVSRGMADGGSLLVPHLMGEPHLTKPPLTYWLQAGAMHLLGDNEFAARLPSAIASSLTLLMLGWVGMRIGGARVGVSAMATLAMMPLFIVISRTTTTDALLSFFWFATLVSGFIAVRSRSAWAVIALWGAVALGLLTKGPVAWIPVVLLIIWLSLGRCWDDLRRLRPGYGLILSALPLLAWAAAVWWHYPEAASRWYRETIGRMGGAGVKHAQPIWYFIPVFIAGLFPATAMMSLPGINLPWRTIRQRLRQASDDSLWAIAVVVPFVVFSIISGKLATYILPLCAPLALLNALMLERWLNGGTDKDQPAHKLPEVVNTLFVCSVLIAAALTGIMVYYRIEVMYRVVPLAMLLTIAAFGLKWVWKRRPQLRGPAMAAFFVCYTAMICGALELEDSLLAPSSNRQMVEFIHEELGHDKVQLVMFGIGDQSLAFYSDDVVDAESPEHLLDMANNPPTDFLVVADPDDWARLQPDYEELFNAFEVWREWDRHWLGKPWWLMRLREPVADQDRLASMASHTPVTAPATP